MRKTWLCAGLMLALAACGALPTPVPRATEGPTPTLSKARTTRTPRPTRTPTEEAQTEAPRPSNTPRPRASRTPRSTGGTPTLPFQVLSSTLTPTVSLGSPAPTTPAPSELDCQLVWQSPSIGATMSAGDKFGAGWDIRNTGTATWEPGSFQFTYLGGYRLSHDFEEPLTQSVPPGEEVILSVPMKVPPEQNLYTTHWGLRQGERFFCRLTVTIWVQLP